MSELHDIFYRNGLTPLEHGVAQALVEVEDLIKDLEAAARLEGERINQAAYRREVKRSGAFDMRKEA